MCWTRKKAKTNDLKKSHSSKFRYLKHELKDLTAWEFYKHFYPEGQEETWRNQQGNRKRCGGQQAWQGLDGRNAAFRRSSFRPIPARPVARERRRGWHRRSDTLQPNKRPIGQPDICRRFRIIAESSLMHAVAVAARMDRGFCSARFRDAGGCGRPRGDQ